MAGFRPQPHNILHKVCVQIVRELKRNTGEAQALSIARVHSTRRSLWPCRRPLCYWLRGIRFPPLQSGHWLPPCNQSRPRNLASHSRVRLHSLDLMLVCV
ncbi:hypothetical protein PGIGA_G00008600 [Pangasianodon gigas]|uniref:Uncharacterized protein n=1 Tax=Pangasianodon gigas TaxID=30993 RepID=A0ACC5W756_PANGG|nr:hypothetical protein [Pangasianodon gigas]